MTRKALGRGLSALLSDRSAIINEEFIEVDIDLIERNHLQPRTVFNEQKLDELAQSIKENGLIQPVLLRRSETGKYQLIAGERRLRAAQRAGLLRIPCVVKDIEDDKMLELALIENIQRQELNPIEEAQAYKKLIETLGLTQEMVAQRVGRDRTFITNYLRLLRLPEDIQSLVEEEKLSMGHARALLGIDDPEIQRKLAKKVTELHLSVREIEKSIKNVVRGSDLSESARYREVKDSNIRFAEDKLRRRLSAKVQINTNKNKGGKIEIHFSDEGDLHRIYEIIMSNGGSTVSTLEIK
jgi:ParB family transcriptional regulator, chromosome partitioning protein